jgi:hypothetical protein
MMQLPEFGKGAILHDFRALPNLNFVSSRQEINNLARRSRVCAQPQQKLAEDAGIAPAPAANIFAAGFG